MHSDAVWNSSIQCLDFSDLHVEPLALRILRWFREALQFITERMVSLLHT